MKQIIFKHTIAKGVQETIATWSFVTDDLAGVVCQNFMDGFLTAVDRLTSYNYYRPHVMSVNGYHCWTKGGDEYDMQISEQPQN